MITISFSVNANAATITSTNAASVRQLAISQLGHANFSAKVNGVAVPLDTTLTHADAVALTTIAAPQVQAPVAAGNGYIQVLYINNDGAGFADKLTVAAGMTVAQLVSQKGIDAARYQVLVNGQHTAADAVLRNGDKLSVTPVKIEGASGGTIEVLLVNNDGSGFASKVTTIDGITMRQFVAQQPGASDPTRITIRVNGQAVTSDTVLRNGDKVSLTPTKIQGAQA